MLSSKYWITNCILLTILAFGAFTPTLAFAAPLANNDKDWQYVGGNSWAWHYSPQTQINKNNVQNLDVKWVFPLSSKALAPAGIQALNPAEGTLTPPIVVNGVVYVTTNSMVTMAVDAKTGKELWINNYEVDLDAARKRLPLSIIPGHFHGIRYWAGEDVVLFGGLTCDIYGVDAKTGKTKFDIPDLCKDIPGSIYNYQITTASTNNLATYDKGRQFIYNIGSTDLTPGVGRAVVMGVSMDTKQTQWRVFNVPPQDQKSKDWALQECAIGYFRNIPCSDVATKARENLEWDFAPGPDQIPSPAAGATQSWGQPVVDEDTGILYINTGNQNPWTNISVTRGPRLFGSTIQAIDMVAGKRIWWQQPMPRDPYDYDCNWSGVLVESPTLGKVYVKGCKEGNWIVSDAKTGKPLIIRDAFEEAYPGKRTVHITDPFSRYDMIEWKWPENSNYHGPAPVKIVPSFLHGTFATDQSYSPETDTIYHYASLMDIDITTKPLVLGVQSGGIFVPGKDGGTIIVARDLKTGNVKWSWPYTYSNQRAHLAVTGGTVFSAFTDGTVKFFNADTGSPLGTVTVGAPVVIGPTIGKDSDGNSKIFIVAGTIPFAGFFGQYGVAGSQTPGTLIAIGLNEKAAAAAQTVTTTSVTTSTTTATTTAVSSTTATTTVTSSAPAQTITTSITQTQTETTGLPSEITYAVAAVAVIAILAAAFLAMRKK
ncbi:MAG: hypothetical protein HYY22_03690 [Thaumarchaeota archaeon]|nr:hypothetical protein [Nitrososphaerota archaeon]